MATLLKQAWTSEIIKNFWNDDSFLMDGRDDSALVDNDFINEAQAGAPTKQPRKRRAMPAKKRLRPVCKKPQMTFSPITKPQKKYL